MYFVCGHKSSDVIYEKYAPLSFHEATKNSAPKAFAVFKISRGTHIRKS